MRRLPKRKRSKQGRMLIYVGVAVVLVLLVGAYFALQPHPAKPIILYVNQGNGRVDRSNFGQLLDFASSKGFNTVFFQVYRQGVLLFNSGDLGYFVNQTHASGMKIFFALYITNSTQPMPSSIYGLGEDGISLDMSTLGLSAQESLLSSLQSAYHGKSAVTTTDMTSPLRPNMLILETYVASEQQYIKSGVVGSVGVFATSSQSDYQARFQYALAHGDGVMVFDYAGLVKSGY